MTHFKLTFTAVNQLTAWSSGTVLPGTLPLNQLFLAVPAGYDVHGWRHE